MKGALYRLSLRALPARGLYSPFRKREGPASGGDFYSYPLVENGGRDSAVADDQVVTD